MKSKHILIVVFFIALWFFTKGYKDFFHSYQNATHDPSGKIDNGKKQGEWKTFYLNGQLKVSSHYLNDTLNGSYLAYFPNGNPHFKWQYKMGVEVDTIIWYHSNGNVNLIEYKDSLGRGQGVFRIYDDKGKLTQEGKYKDGHIVDYGNIRINIQTKNN